MAENNIKSEDQAVVMSPEDLSVLVANAVTAAVTALAPILGGSGEKKAAPEERIKIKFTADPAKNACSEEERLIYHKGAVCELPMSSANRWIRRNVAVKHTRKKQAA